MMAVINMYCTTEPFQIYEDNRDKLSQPITITPEKEIVEAILKGSTSNVKIQPTYAASLH